MPVCTVCCMLCDGHYNLLQHFSLIIFSQNKKRNQFYSFYSALKTCRLWIPNTQFPFSNLLLLLREPVCRWWSWLSCQSALCAWRGWTSPLTASSRLSATTAFTASVCSAGKMPRELCRHTHTHTEWTVIGWNIWTTPVRFFQLHESNSSWGSV